MYENQTVGDAPFLSLGRVVHHLPEHPEGRRTAAVQIQCLVAAQLFHVGGEFRIGHSDRVTCLPAIDLDEEERIFVPADAGAGMTDRGPAGQYFAIAKQSISGVELIDPLADEERVERYADHFYRDRQRKGMSLAEARERMRHPLYFGCMMLSEGDADGLVAGEDATYPDTLRPALEVIGTAPHVRHVAGLYMMILQQDLMFFADTTVNIDPDAETLAEIALLSAGFVKRLGIEPRIAMLSFSNFGSARHPQSNRVREATEIVKQRAPELQIDGEMQADTAVVQDILEHSFPFSGLKQPANVLIFPDLNAANTSYKLLARLGGAEAIGPILLGMAKPVHILQRGSQAADILNLAAIATVDAHRAPVGPARRRAGQLKAG